MAELGPAQKHPRKHCRPLVRFVPFKCFPPPLFPPPRQKQPGDFGTVNKKTGGLNVEGNIYSHPDIAPIAYKYLPIEGAVVDHYQINSFEVRVSDVTAAVGA